MDALKDMFAQKKREGIPALVTFVTAGYPKPEDTVTILLAMQSGGASIIELGIPFSDPVADGPTIQERNAVAVRQGVDYATCLDLLRRARSEGLTVPVILMGYYNPILAYGEDKAVRDAAESGANGFIVVDLPPEEATIFRDRCAQARLSYVPLIAPSTPLRRIKFLASIADSFIYVVSKMGTTGSSPSGKLNTSLPDAIARIREHTKIPLAVGFGVATREHFDTVADAGADGVVIGSMLINIIRDSSKEFLAENVKTYCLGMTSPSQADIQTTKNESKPVHNGIGPSVLPSRFGSFGGQYVPESLFGCLQELEEAHRCAMSDPAFWEEFRSFYDYMNRPSKLHKAQRLSDHAGGATIWLKREDLCHTGSYKINNALGQLLLARRIGKTRIVAETGGGQHGLATATVCARFGMKCVIYMGAADVLHQTLNVFKMRMLGATVVPVNSGSCALKDAVNEAMRDLVENLSDTYYLIGSAIGPHPFPTIVRDFQKIIGQEIKVQLHYEIGQLPDAVVACVGSGSNAIGAFFDFIDDRSVRLVGVEAGGDGLDGGRHSATLAGGRPGVLHGGRTYVLQSPTGQIAETHAMCAELDYPAVGPEHAWLKDSGRAEYVTATDEEALRGFKLVTQLEGIVPAIESAFAIWEGVQLASNLPKDSNIVICLSGGGDKDLKQVSELLSEHWGNTLGWHVPS